MKPKKRVHASTDAKKMIISKARKAQTAMTNVIDMIEHDRYCIDILQQALAVSGLWRGVIEGVLEDHLRGCFVDQLCHGSARDHERAIQEVIRVLNLTKRS